MKRSLLTLAALCALASAPAAPAAAPASTPAATSANALQASVWNLQSLYASEAQWEAERQALSAELPKLKALQGTLGQSAATLRAGLDQISAFNRRLMRLAVYASLKADENTQLTEHQARNQLATTLANQAGEATAWVSADVVKLGQTQVEAFIAAEPGLARHAQTLRTLVRRAAHTLSSSEEGLMASAAEPLQQPSEIYNLLSNADLPWPKLTVRGKTVVLDQEQYVALRADPDPKVREQVFKTFWPVYKAYERTIGAIYTAHLKGTAFEARARKYPNSLSMALAGDNIPESVYRTLVQEARAALPVLHRYLKLRTQMLGLKQAGYQDMYVALAKSDKRYTQPEGEALTLAALQPLGSDYTTTLKKAFGEGWMHAVPQRGKRSGAYMNGAAYDVHPFLLMSYNGDLSSVSTLAHEWGHAMHTVYANSQPFENANYATFTAEIPSTANELLLADYMLAQAKTRDEKIFALSQQLENLRGTFFRQAMFAEFELAAHEAVGKGEAVNGEKLSSIYLDLLRHYHGHAQGVVHIDALYGVEWAYIPHFYGNFYVYQYATSISAAAYFAEGIGKGDSATRERFFTLLKAGGSADPYVLTRNAGVDLAQPEPYRALVRRMEHGVQQLEALLGSKAH
ncbi:oligoendopeptidase F [Roseateles sp. BYS180W]|uniref:Oligopeptidase F n=1 Tax=Roseateles rivi TaxID=3299028 RepID=A0ABW7FTG3_9BURK